MLHRLSIRSILGGIIVAMGVLIILLAGFNLQSAYQRNRAAQRVVALARIDGHVFNAMTMMRVERGTILGTLSGASAATAATTDLIANFRAQSEASFGKAVAMLAESDKAIPELAGLAARMRSAHDAMAALRLQTDAALRQDKPARDAEVMRAAPVTSQAYQDALVAMGDQLEASMKLVNAAIDQLVALKQSAWIVRLYSGSLSIRIETAAAVRRPLETAELVAAAEDRGRMKMAWSELATIAARQEIPASVVTAVTSAPAMFPAAFLAQEDEIVQALADHPDKLALSFPELQRRNVAEFGLVGEVASLALRETGTLAERQAAEAQSVLLSSIVILLLAIGLTVGGYLIAVRRISVPLGAMTNAMRQLANHDLSADIPGTGRGDEIGAMAAAVQVFKDSMTRADALAAERDKAENARQRRQAAMDHHTQDFGSSVSGVMASLAGAAGEMRRAAAAMTEAAAGVRRKAGDTVTSGGKASQELASVAAAVEQLTASVAEISRQVATAAEVARDAVHRAESGHATMRGLAEATARIGDVVHLISDIAGQTNLLALNATIEAARAGEAGRGFAVVAGEVKALAGQTAKATADIGGQIAAVRTATEQSINAMTEVTAVIGRIDAVASAIAAAVEQQNATTRAIASSIQHVSGATDATVQAMQSVAGMADGAGGVSEEVTEAATAIGHQAETLRVEVDQFLTAVRNDDGERRRYERIPGNGARVALRMPGKPGSAVVLENLSRGGAALRCDLSLAAGSQLELELPGDAGPISARVVRSGGGRLAVVFPQEPSALARIDRALDMVGRIAAAA
jgi:methyl-accepting chemotaxis protein